jgi:hypothetical protein
MGILSIAASVGGAAAESNVMFIFDSSGSMKTSIGRESRMDAAKRAMVEALASIPTDARVGLTLYGHRRAKDCGDIELVSPVGADRPSDLAQTIKGLQPKGETPIAESLRHALRSFAAFKGQNNRIVLVTDGIEECRGDPCAAAQAIADAGLELKVDIVGFTLNAAQRSTMKCVTEKTGGTYYDAQDARGLTTALAEVRETVAAPLPPPAPPPAAAPNLLSPKNGGELLTSPNDVWLATNDDKEVEVAWLRDGQEAVYGFKNGAAATFDTFGVFIARSANNPKEIELFAGDDGPTGQFRAVGKCTFQNIKLLKAPYQPCKFAPVTAKFLKVRIVSSYGDSYVYATEFQLLGSLSAAAATSVAAPAPVSLKTAELLSPTSGGELLAAPSETWNATNDGEEKEVAWLRDGQEGVYGFKGGAAATFDSFGVYVARSANNPKEIELLAGDDGPTGQFRSIAKCTFQNLKLLKAPYQPCKFAPVTAKFLKVKILSSYGDSYVYATEFHLWGQLGGAAPAASAAPVAPVAAVHTSGHVNVLSPTNGGELLAAPSDTWAATVDDKTAEVAWLRDGQEAVYGFRNGAAATFDSFGVYIARSANNPKEVELLAGDESPTGQFRSVAKCTFQNVKLLKAPYQPCTFAPVTAKFLKVKILSSYGDSYVYATEFQLLGQVAK